MVIARHLPALLALLACSPAPDAAPDRVVLIVVDTLRRDALSCYGGTTPTPVIDALAARGTRFTNASASYFQTSMSMGALFTGRTPSTESGDPARPLHSTGRTWCGLARFADAEQETCIPDSLETLAERMRRAGYWTVGITSNNYLFDPYGLSRGFDDWTQVGRRHPIGRPFTDETYRRLIASRTAEKVNAAALAAWQRRSGERTFLYVHYMDVHDYREGDYQRGVAAVDRAIGQLLDAVEAADPDGRTLVIVTSDHGERLGEDHFVPGNIAHGGDPAFGEMLRVPLISSLPAPLDAQRLIRTQDVYGLIAAFAGQSSAGPADSALSPEELYLSEPAFQTYQSGRWKSYRRRADDTLFLIDVENDPGETRDVARERPEIVAAHRARVAELTRALAAPDAADTPLSEEDRSRLRALGYLE